MNSVITSYLIEEDLEGIIQWVMGLVAILTVRLMALMALAVLAVPVVPVIVLAVLVARGVHPQTHLTLVSLS
jgi:hypothetical protein